MKSPPLTLNDTQRSCVDAAVRVVCEHRDWALLAINVRTNHVHVVVSAGVPVERAMNAFKVWSTRALRDEQLITDTGSPWSRHGSTGYLWTEADVESACAYVLYGQDRA